jgi:ABC-type molybdenum transport system ATPase subunit/photorepair protein PhrA
LSGSRDCLQFHVSLLRNPAAPVEFEFFCVIFIERAVPMKDRPALELRRVSYHAGGQKILDSTLGGVSWRTLGDSRPNGSGKTTLLMLAGASVILRN